MPIRPYPIVVFNDGLVYYIDIESLRIIREGNSNTCFHFDNETKLYNFIDHFELTN